MCGYAAKHSPAQRFGIPWAVPPVAGIQLIYGFNLEMMPAPDSLRGSAPAYQASADVMIDERLFLREALGPGAPEATGRGLRLHDPLAGGMDS